MKTITMLEFRNNSEKVLGLAKQGVSMIMTYRGKPLMRLEPIRDESHSINDSFYHLPDMADKKAQKLSNKEMDKLIYGS